ncbi:MAG: hypothetical protein HFG26_06985 [Provencibacterium sp.]|jgi:predicted transcriptional regulator YheO|nr:hypothetical protein [Provencibacterium sp.]
MLETYKKLVAFLGLVLGEHCKVVLFDLTRSPPVVVAIANGTMEGGKGMGAPLTHVARKIIENEEWKTCDYKSEFLGQTRQGELLKSSYFFIKDGERLIGMLSINSSATQYQKLCQDILRLGGFSSLLTLQAAESAAVPDHFSESFSNVSELVSNTLDSQFAGINATRLTQAEKMTVIRALYDKGVFLIKGAVPEVAQALSCSEATVYRYLSKLSRGTR